MEEHYNFEDAILNGLILITFLKHADRVKMACLAQLVNVIAPIMTEVDGIAWKQTIFYPFLHAPKYGRGSVLQPIISTGRHDTSRHEDVTDIEAVAVYREETDEITIFAVNRNVEEDIAFEADMRSLGHYYVKEYLVLESNDMKLVNSAFAQAVKPVTKKEYKYENGVFKTVMKRCSWNVIRLGG